MYRNKTASSHSFAMVPRADIPRSAFKMQKTLKTTFDAGYLVPFFCEEIIPGDTWNVKTSAFVRLATPIFPVMDNLWLETFFFFCPNRIVWDNFVKMMGEQDNPADSISFTIPQLVSTAGGYAVGSIFDQFGLPCAGQVTGGLTYSHSALPLRMYNLIWNEWFRDENLQNSVTVQTNDGPDVIANYNLLRRGKRHDYFTSCLPWTQKGGVAVSMPLSGNAPIRTQASDTVSGAQQAMNWKRAADGANPGAFHLQMNAGGGTTYDAVAGGAGSGSLYPSNLYADLASATGATINALRTSFQIQRLLERDARGGTRYTELVQSHFGVRSPDARLQRPEYLGGGKTPIVINPIAQTSATGLTGGSTPAGNLAAMGTGLLRGHAFTQSFTEHGYVIGLMHVHADLTYQQGLRKHWSRLTRYDMPWPVFSMLGEQAVLNKEIYLDGSANDALTFGYQERYAELRYNPSEIHGLFRSTSAGTIDPWHLSQRFTGLPALNSTFIQDTPPVSRVLAVGAGANGQQLLADIFFDMVAVRPIPKYGTPGLIDHL